LLHGQHQPALLVTRGRRSSNEMRRSDVRVGMRKTYLICQVHVSRLCTEVLDAARQGKARQGRPGYHLHLLHLMAQSGRDFSTPVARGRGGAGVGRAYEFPIRAISAWKNQHQCMASNGETSISLGTALALPRLPSAVRNFRRPNEPRVCQSKMRPPSDRMAAPHHYVWP
jgi:hypothetical protein